VLTVDKKGRLTICIQQHPKVERYYTSESCDMLCYMFVRFNSQF